MQPVELKREEKAASEPRSVLDVLPPNFFEAYWRRSPLLLRGAAEWMLDLVTTDELDAFEDDYTRAPASWRTGSVGRIGSTSYISNGECLNEELAGLCDRLRREFRWPHGEIAIVHNREAASWVTSGPHFDQVDNFITQVTGEKQWRLWPTTDVERDEKRRRVLRQPHYGEHAIPDEPVDLVDVVVGPGDLLYLPLFWGHAVRALGPGIMLSINLKALLPSEVLLRGMSRQLADLPEEETPLPLPGEVADWDSEVERALADAFAAVSRRLAPAAANGSAGSSAKAVTVAETGLADVASNRHASLLRRERAAEPAPPSRHVARLAEVLRTTPLDLRPLRAPGSDAGVAGIVDAFAAVHLHRFLGLLSLGPQQWWPAPHRDGWAEQREALEAAETSQLLQAASDTQLVELTTKFRGDLLAFNRRHAVQTLAVWAERFRELPGEETAATPPVFADAGCTMPAEPDVASRVEEALALVDTAWPGFARAFARLAGAVATTRNGWQARQAGRRPRLAVVNAEWTVPELAEALTGELARIATQLVERVGVVAPARRAAYRGTWRSSPSEVSRAAALLEVARYVDRQADTGRAEQLRRLAAELLAQEAATELTVLGRDLVQVLSSAATGAEPPAELGAPSVADVLRELEALEPDDAREFVEGHTVEYARFRWTKLGAPRGTIGPEAGVGMDCNVPPWIVR